MSARARLELPFTPPLDWPRLLRFFSGRATAGVEAVEDGRYRRAIEWDGAGGALTVEHDACRARLVATIDGPVSEHASAMRARLNHMFDLHADPAAISATCDTDPWLGGLRRGAPGVRVPGTWSAFELVVRTIVGQQVSVKAATTIMGRLVSRAGTPIDDHAHAATAWRFPTPGQLACADLSHIGMPGKRVAALQGFAQAVAQGSLSLDYSSDGASLAELAGARAALLAMPGIGAWTVEYVAMRAWRDADAWPATDLVLRQGMLARHPEAIKPADQLRRAAAWQPWRAYAAVHIWSAVADQAGGARGG